VNWRKIASCRDGDPDLFFPIGHSASGPTLVQVDEAKAVCRRCPVMRQCLAYALDAHPVEGIWGGTTENERRSMRRSLTDRSRRASSLPV
jgi:WhiB family transcriptional regulator, redox-sensing transcriptional regulator